MPFYLAIDAGGTKTDYVLADDHHELARTRSGTIKRMRTDETSALRNLDEGLAALTELSGILPAAVTRTCIGTAGETVPLVTRFLREAFASRVGGELLLLGDVEIALDAAFPGRPGVLVLAGTGSNIAGRNALGELTSAGGWGPALADQGSGHRIGLEALRRAFLTRDEGRATSLFKAVYEFWQIVPGETSQLDQLVAAANVIPAPDFSKLVPLVLACALDGDEVASLVLAQEGKDLGYLTRLVLRRLMAAAPFDPGIPPVAFAGSIMERVHPVRNALIADLREEFVEIETVAGVVDPVLGALWRARQG